MTIQIKNLSACEQIDMTAVRGGDDKQGGGTISISQFNALIDVVAKNEGAAGIIYYAGYVDINQK